MPCARCPSLKEEGRPGNESESGRVKFWRAASGRDREVQISETVSRVVKCVRSGLAVVVPLSIASIVASLFVQTLLLETGASLVSDPVISFAAEYAHR